MTNSKKLMDKELASVKGGGATGGKAPSGLAKASSGRTPAKSVFVGPKRR